MIPIAKVKVRLYGVGKLNPCTMKKLLLLLAATSVILLVSCNKQNAGPQQRWPVPTELVTTLSRINGGNWSPQWGNNPPSLTTYPKYWSIQPWANENAQNQVWAINSLPLVYLGAIQYQTNTPPPDSIAKKITAAIANLQEPSQGFFILKQADSTSKVIVLSQGTIDSLIKHN